MLYSSVLHDPYFLTIEILSLLNICYSAMEYLELTNYLGNRRHFFRMIKSFNSKE